jgi:murein DD-endopeptidase MepM/ murein hydrolase activator NlpD
VAHITPSRSSLALAAALATTTAAAGAHATPGLGVSQPGLFAPQSSFDAAPSVPDADEAPPPVAPPPKKPAPSTKASVIGEFIRHITDAPGAHITSDYGGRMDPMGDRGSWHSGVDIAAPLGASIFAAAGGVVTVATYDSGCGFMVEIAHKTGMRSRYCHAAALLVEKGEVVDEGQRIAIVGATGEATGPHVHFEVRKKDGRAMDPHAAMKKRLLDAQASTSNARRASR